MPSRKDHREARVERLPKVAALYLRVQSKSDIARVLKVDRKTVERDINMLEAVWHQELVEDPVAVKTRELAELADMEREAAQHVGDLEWSAFRLRVKERRAKLLGLDAPQKREVAGPGGGPVAVTLFDLVKGASKIIESADYQILEEEAKRRELP